MSDNEIQPHPDFPFAPSGDVHISLGGMHKYTLHSSVLRRGSTFFADSLTEENTQVPEKLRNNTGRVARWRFELRDVPPDEEGGSGTLGMIELDAKGMIKPTGQPMQGRAQPYSEAGRPPSAVRSYYHRVLGAVHSLPFDVSEEDLGTLLRDVLGIVAVAEYLGSLSCVIGRLNLALLNQNQVLYRAIAKNPAAWAELSVRLKSEVIFRETVIHLVGRWNTVTLTQKYDLPPDMRSLCERKAEAMSTLKKRIEHKIVKYYPDTLTRNPKEPETYNRQSYGNDVFGWIAINLFRHWYCAALASDRGRHAQDGGFQLYKDFAVGGDAYLKNTEVNSFHETAPMTVKGKSVFNAWLKGIKNDVGKLVRPLLIDYSTLDTRDGELHPGYLTCIDVKREDLPWVVERSKRKRAQDDEQRRKHRHRQPLGAAGEDVEEDEYDSEDFGGGLGGVRSTSEGSEMEF